MITIKNDQKEIEINVHLMKKQVQKMLDLLKYSDFDLGIWLTSNDTIHEYNKRYRDKDAPTDILSFPYHDLLTPGERITPEREEDKNLGDIILAPSYIEQDAPKWGQDLTQRLPVLLAHGITHLLGYDHQTDDEFARMNELEKKLLAEIA